MPRFRTRNETQPPAESPEALFRDLRPRAETVRHLWSHQADLLRSYQVLDVRDVAIELPTGAGKTLVGLLLAEFRRRAENERVAYLCPTVQLARQAAAAAADYGIDAVALVRRQSEYDAGEFLAFQRAQKIAITTYHGVFNTNPRIEAQALVLDDAHAAEGAVADLWSVEAHRGTPLYAVLLAAVGDGLTDSFREDVRDDDLDPTRRYTVELAPPTFVAERGDLLREAIDTHAVDHNHYSGQMIAARAEQCLLYVSWSQILIRPFIAPTSEHPPFADANQRIYMSATLGQGGELERIFGVEGISRLPAPTGWDEHGSGRRFFLFPSASLDPPAADTFVAEAIERTGKALVLAPSNAELDSFSQRALPDGFPQLRSRDFEDDFKSFADAGEGALLLANRYDGLDLPDEACRLIVLAGLPTATHLQERFLYDRLKARRVLAERIRTRLTQGAGRCTRNPQDYAAVIMLGDKLVDFCARDENRSTLHPELQAELEFGLDNSEDGPELGALLDSFLAQDEHWNEGDADIRARIPDAVRAGAPDADALSSASPYEVAAWRAIWRGDLADAIDSARRAADELTTEELRPYRALWLYLAASWAYERAEASGNEADAQFARQLKRDVDGCARTLPFVPRLSVTEPASVQGAEYDTRAERAAAILRTLGVRGSRRFEQCIAQFLEQINGDEATPFELGLETLGELLGFESVRPNAQADPDAIWRDEERQWFLFEAKTEVQASRPVAAEEVRQATTHKQWALNRYEWQQPESDVTVIVTHQTAIEDSAATVAGDVYMVSPAVLRQLAGQTVDVHRQIRTAALGMSDEQMRAAFAAAFNDRNLDTGSLVERLVARRVADA